MEGCQGFFNQLNHINGALYHLNALGFAELAPVIGELNRMRGELLSKRKLGIELPRINVTMRTITGLSPGLVRVWYEMETGWFAEGRDTPNSRPVYTSITTEQAVRLLKNPPDRDLAHELMKKVTVDIDN